MKNIRQTPADRQWTFSVFSFWQAIQTKWLVKEDSLISFSLLLSEHYLHVFLTRMFLQCHAYPWFVPLSLVNCALGVFQDSNATARCISVVSVEYVTHAQFNVYAHLLRSTGALTKKQLTGQRLQILCNAQSCWTIMTYHLRVPVTSQYASIIKNSQGTVFCSPYPGYCNRRERYIVHVVYSICVQYWFVLCRLISTQHRGMSPHLIAMKNMNSQSQN